MLTAIYRPHFYRIIAFSGNTGEQVFCHIADCKVGIGTERLAFAAYGEFIVNGLRHGLPRYANSTVVAGFKHRGGRRFEIDMSATNIEADYTVRL